MVGTSLARLFGLDGTTCTTLSFAAWVYPMTYIMNKIIDKIPGVNKLDVNVSKLGNKLGILEIQL